MADSLPSMGIVAGRAVVRIASCGRDVAIDLSNRTCREQQHHQYYLLHEITAWTSLETELLRFQHCSDTTDGVVVHTLFRRSPTPPAVSEVVGLEMELVS